MIELSLYVYIASGMYLVSMNGVRQYLTAAIIFTATKYILDGNWKRYFLIVLFASTFHQSALVLIPIYFVVRRKAWSTITFILLFIAVLIVIGFNQFAEIFFATIGIHNMVTIRIFKKEELIFFGLLWMQYRSF